MVKGRRTEIEYLKGFVVREGEQVGIQARANTRLVDIVKKVERDELKQDPRHITELPAQLSVTQKSRWPAPEATPGD
jgi:2-dehydropantoate 2-reductase